MPLPLIAGVDGGGTKTEVTIGTVRGDGMIVACGTKVVGPGNLHSATPESIGRTCHEALQGLLAGKPLQAICFAMAGAGDPVLAHRLEDWATQYHLANRIIVTHDARSLIAAGTTNDEGIALIAGTGSMAYCRTNQGTEDRCGGWGFMFGDEGSAYDLAIAALRHAVATLDGRQPRSMLVDLISRHFQPVPPRGWLKVLQSQPRNQIADLARLVTQAAQAADPVAQGLIGHSAQCLSELVVTLAKRHWSGQPIELVLAGGLARNVTGLRDQIEQSIIEQGVPLRATMLVEHPALGALRLAGQAIQAE
jgi:N-acetylglucosamine kinase-like BadF-type ATPase